VTDWDNIKATNRPLPDLTGWLCTCGIDYAAISDFASVNLHFRKGDERFDVNHSWLCLQSKDLFRIKAPWREWAEQGLITLVDDVEIHPDMLCGWISNQAQKYQITKLALDNHRYALVSASLRKIGFDAKHFKNVHLVRPSDIMKIQTVIDSTFNNQKFIWGDNPVLRWAANNTKLVKASKSIGSDTGNFYYAKIEGKSRKTDPFMAAVASMVIEGELGTGESSFDDLPVIIG
jgi:phage terminase large subunit-like protein